MLSLATLSHHSKERVEGVEASRLTMPSRTKATFTEAVVPETMHDFTASLSLKAITGWFEKWFCQRSNATNTPIASTSKIGFSLSVKRRVATVRSKAAEKYSKVPEK